MLILATSPVARCTRARQESQKPHSPFYFASPATCWPPQPSKDKMFVHYFRAGSMALHPPYAQTEGCSRLRLHVDTTAALLPASPGRQGFLEATITLSLRGEKAFCLLGSISKALLQENAPHKKTFAPYSTCRDRMGIVSHHLCRDKGHSSEPSLQHPFVLFIYLFFARHILHHGRRSLRQGGFKGHS